MAVKQQALGFEFGLFGKCSRLAYPTTYIKGKGPIFFKTNISLR